MLVPEPTPVFHTREYFKVLYNPVTNPVFLLHTSEGVVLEANEAFRAYLPSPGDAGPIAGAVKLQPRFWFDGTVAKNQKTAVSLEFPGGSVVAVDLVATEALLADEKVLLCFVQVNSSQSSQGNALAAAEAEKKALLNEVYHRVKNNLNIIISLLQLQMNRVQDPEVKKLLLESKSRIFTLALLQERLYLSPKLSEVKANEYLTKLAHSVVNTYKGDQQLHLETDTEECWLKVDTLVPLGLLVHELVSNAVLHAFNEQKEGTIHLSFSPADEDGYSLTVADNGRGLAGEKAFDTSKTLGVQLINSLVKQLKAQRQVESTAGAGTKFIISFPKPIR